MQEIKDVNHCPIRTSFIGGNSQKANQIPKHIILNILGNNWIPFNYMGLEVLWIDKDYKVNKKNFKKQSPFKENLVVTMRDQQLEMDHNEFYQSLYILSLYKFSLLASDFPSIISSSCYWISFSLNNSKIMMYLI